MIKGTAIDRYLRATFISQAKFARKLNVSPSWVSYLRQGKALPSARLALKIAEITGLDLEDILNPPKPHPEAEDEDGE